MGGTNLLTGEGYDVGVVPVQEMVMLARSSVITTFQRREKNRVKPLVMLNFENVLISFTYAKNSLLLPQK